MPLPDGWTSPDGWIPCRDRVPDPGVTVAISDGRTVDPGFRNPDDNDAWYYLTKHGAYLCFIIPLVWQPLPPLPVIPGKQP
jgi:hypothetical protein